MIKFTLVSDLHADFPQESIDYNKLEQHVIVAGDTTNGLECLRFLSHKLREKKGHDVYAVCGNHEHYANYNSGRDIHETEARFREESPAYIEGTEDFPPVALRTGWYTVSDEPLWQRYMNDSKRMVVSAEQMNELAKRDASALRDVLQNWKDLQLKGIVVTHMSPCEETLDPKYRGAFSNEWYWSPLLRPLLTEYAEQIHVWCHGHTHAANDKVVDGVRVVCNPRGYPGENRGWGPLTISLDKG